MCCFRLSEHFYVKVVWKLNFVISNWIGTRKHKIGNRLIKEPNPPIYSMNFICRSILISSWDNNAISA